MPGALDVGQAVRQAHELRQPARSEPSHGVRLSSVIRPPRPAEKGERRQERRENPLDLAEGKADVDLPGFQAVKAASQWKALALARLPLSSITGAHQRRPQHASAAAPASTPAAR